MNDDAKEHPGGAAGGCSARISRGDVQHGERRRVAVEGRQQRSERVVEVVVELGVIKDGPHGAHGHGCPGHGSSPGNSAPATIPWSSSKDCNAAVQDSQ